MILDKRSAAVLINGYQKLLLEIGGPAGGNVKLLERLAKGRRKLMTNVSLLEDAVSRIHNRGQHVDETVVVAAASLQVKSWVYLCAILVVIPYSWSRRGRMPTVRLV
jgi:hypothetical protein